MIETIRVMTMRATHGMRTPHIRGIRHPQRRKRQRRRLRARRSRTTLSLLLCPGINLLQTYETERYGSLMSPVAEYIGKRDTDGGLGDIVNIEDYILTECRLNESSKIGEAVIKLFDDKGRGQLPPIPIGGGTENPQAQADWDTFNKWIHHQGPRPSVSASAAQSNGNWYYCEPTHAYYPNVTSCSVPWRQGN